MATNYEQAGIEAVNRLFKPMAEGMDTQQQLQRQAGLLGLQRQTQLDDAATARSQQLSDAEAAQQRGLERITKQAQEQSRLQQEAEERTKNTRTQEMKDELNALYQRIQGKGSVNLSFNPTQIKTASFGALSAMMREAAIEEEIIKQNRKSHAELFERFQSLAKSEIGREVLLEQIGAEEGDSIDLNEVAKHTKSDLQEIIGTAIPIINSRKYDNSIVKPYKRVLKQQNELLNDTGLGDLLSENRTPVSLEAGPALARDQQFLVELFPNIKDDRYLGDSTQDDYASIIAALNEGDLDAVMGMLQKEGQGALTAYSSAYQRWMQSTAASQTSAQASALQSYLLKNQDNLGKLREVGKIIDGYQQNHPWIQFAVSIEDTVTNKDIQEGRLKAEQRANAGGPLGVTTDSSRSMYETMVGGQDRPVTPPVTPPVEGAGANLLQNDSEIDSAANPPAQAPAATQTSSPSWVQNQPDYMEIPFLPNTVPFPDRDKSSGYLPDEVGKIGVPNPLTFNRKNWTPPTAEDYEDINLSIVGGSSLATRDMSQDKMSRPTQGWFGRQATALKQALAPRTDLSFISPSMAPLYDDPDAGPAGMGDVALEMADLYGMAWLTGTGLRTLKNSPAALKRVNDLRKAHPGGIPLRELVNGLGKGPALESLKSFLRRTFKLKTPAGPIPPQRRLTFTPPPSGPPIITPPPSSVSAGRTLTQPAAGGYTGGTKLFEKWKSPLDPKWRPDESMRDALKRSATNP